MPYELYGKVDYMYGWPAYHAGNGFTAAQGSLNALETVGYIGYLWVVWKKGEGERKELTGGWGGIAVLCGFALSVMTLSKTILYCKLFSLDRGDQCVASPMSVDISAIKPWYWHA